MIWRVDLMMRSGRWETVSGLAPAFFWIVSLGTYSLKRTIGLMKRITGSGLTHLRRSLFRPLRKKVTRAHRSLREESVPCAVHGGKHEIRTYHAHGDLLHSTRKTCFDRKKNHLTVIDLDD